MKSHATRWARVARLAAVCIAVCLWSPAVARSASTNEPLPFSVVMNQARSSTLSVGAWGSSTHAGVSLCLWGTRWLERSPSRRVLISEGGCERSSTVHGRFDPAPWSARINGWMQAQLTREVIERVDGEWVTTSWSQRHGGRIVLDLSWTGHGPPEPHADVRGQPLGCYALPPICTSASASVSKPATVVGAIRFERLKTSVAIRTEGRLALG